MPITDKTTELENTMKVIGMFLRTTVSNSPQVKPKLPSPIMATIFLSGRPMWAPMGRLEIQWRLALRASLRAEGHPTQLGASWGPRGASWRAMMAAVSFSSFEPTGQGAYEEPLSVFRGTSGAWGPRPNAECSSRRKLMGAPYT